AAVGGSEDERGVGPEVAEAGFARYLDGEGRRLRYAPLAGFDGSAQRLADEPLIVALHPRPRGGKDSRRDAGPGRGERSWRSLYAQPPGRSNDTGGPSAARALRALRCSDAPRPRRPARALSRSASHSPGGPSSARALRALRASDAPGPRRPARALSRSASPSNSTGGPCSARALRALRTNP